MNHPAELTLAKYMTDAANGDAIMSDETIKKIGEDIVDALKRQFGGGTKRGKFGLRMSNIGKPHANCGFKRINLKKQHPCRATL